MTQASLNVVWAYISPPNPAPVWVVVVAVLAGLLLLALLIFIMYKVSNSHSSSRETVRNAYTPYSLLARRQSGVTMV